MNRYLLGNLTEEEVVAQARQFKKDSPDAAGRHLRRLHFLSGVLALFSLLIIYRLFDLQVIHGQENWFWAQENFLYWQTQPAPRGIVFSADGKVLARNQPALSAALLGANLPAQPEPGLVESLAQALDLPLQEVLTQYRLSQEKPHQLMILKDSLAAAEQVAVKALQKDFPGAVVLDDQLRTYPAGSAFSAVLGYTALLSPAEIKSRQFADYELTSRVGREGLERAYEAYLRPRPGKKLMLADAHGGGQKVLREEAGESGKNLILSLRADWQELIYEKLAAAMEKYAATGAVFIAMEVGTGRILSLVTLPTYDNNSLVLVKPVQEPLGGEKEPVLFNRALAGLYPPGSTIKPAVGAAALQEKVISPNSRFSDSPQVIRIGPWEFPDWTVAWGAAAHGWLDVKEALAQSCDIFFYKVGGGFTPQQGVEEKIEGLGVERLKVYLKLFGLGELTGIDLPGEAEGLVPDPIWKEEKRGEAWFLGNTYHLSIGQGDLLATPLQILNLTNTIANGGRVLQPHLADRVEDEAGNLAADLSGSQVVRQNFIEPQFIRIIQEGMRLAVKEGIVYPLRGAKVAVAAKTGTAEFGTPDAKGEYQTHAWVTGFAPYDSPEVAFVLLLESGGASSNAAEVAREILDEYFQADQGDRGQS